MLLLAKERNLKTESEVVFGRFSEELNRTFIIKAKKITKKATLSEHSESFILVFVVLVCIIV